MTPRERQTVKEALRAMENATERTIKVSTPKVADKKHYILTQSDHRAVVKRLQKLLSDDSGVPSGGTLDTSSWRRPM